MLTVQAGRENVGPEEGTVSRRSAGDRSRAEEEWPGLRQGVVVTCRQVSHLEVGAGFSVTTAVLPLQAFVFQAVPPTPPLCVRDGDSQVELGLRGQVGTDFSRRASHW